MKTAISLPDDLYRQADRLARKLKKSRSQLYRDAVAEYLARHDADLVTEAMDRIADQIDTRLDSFSAAASHQILKKTEW